MSQAIRQFHEKRLKMQQAEREKVQLERARVAKAVSETSDMDVDASLVVQGEEQRPPLELESSSKRRRTSKVCVWGGGAILEFVCVTRISRLMLP